MPANIGIMPANHIAKKEERVMRIYKMLFVALFMAVFMAGCSNSNNGPGDTTPPTVTSTNPADTATGVPTNQQITAIFSEAVTNCTTTTFTLVDTVATTAVTGTVTCVDRTAVFTPTSPSPLAVSTMYTATITTGVTDLAGNKLAANKVWSFTTGTTTDTTAPAVSSTTPADTATGVVLNSTINATFSKAMDPTTITTTTFTLMATVAGTPVSGTVTSSGSVATFTPGSNLAASTSYTATITTGATDLSGNPLASNVTWAFTTGTTVAANPGAVNLGTAGDYAIFANSGIDTSPGASIITGDIGLGPAVTSTAFTGFTPTNVPSTFATFAEVSGKAYAFDYAPPTPTRVNTASLDMGTAYTDAAGRTATSAATTNVGGGTLTGLTLTAGVYEWGSAVTIPTDLTLSGSSTDVWIFKVAGTLDMAAAKNVILAGSAQSKNIFWQVSGATTIGANTHFEGIILDQTAITFGANSSINGRLLAQTAVNLNATTVAQP
jgi:hypothetical protein